MEENTALFLGLLWHSVWKFWKMSHFAKFKNYVLESSNIEEWDLFRYFAHCGEFYCFFHSFVWILKWGLTSVSGGLYDCRDFNRALSVGISRGFLFSSVKGFSKDKFIGNDMSRDHVFFHQLFFQSLKERIKVGLIAEVLQCLHTRLFTVKAVSTGMKNVWRPGRSKRSNFFIDFTWLEKFLKI